MLKSVAGIAGVAALVLVGGARPAHAMTDDVVVTARVPVAFQVAGRTMPAGNYQVGTVEANDLSLLEIQNADAHGPDALFLTTPQGVHSRIGQAELVFDRDGGQNVLQAIRVPGDTGDALPVAATEAPCRK